MKSRLSSCQNVRGQSLVETAIMLPLLLLLVLNVVNFGFFYLVMLNLTGAARTSVEYSILGPSTPAQLSQPPTPGPADGSAAGNLTVTYIAQQDMGVLANYANSSIQICSALLGLNASGQAKCQTCTGTSCAAAVTTGSPAQDTDPESTFVLNEVDITYNFRTLIPGQIFNIPLRASGLCNSGTCSFTRRAKMRAMN